MLQVRRVLETALYCDDLAKTVEFYKAVLALEPMRASERVAAFHAGEGTVLLLFQRGVSDHPFDGAGGLVPGHVSTGPAHFAFAVDREDVSPWLRTVAGASYSCREPRRLGARGAQHLLSRSRRPLCRVGHAGNMALLLTQI